MAQGGNGSTPGAVTDKNEGQDGVGADGNGADAGPQLREKVKTFKPDDIIEAPVPSVGGAPASAVEAARERVQPVLVERLDVQAAVSLDSDELRRQVGEVVLEIIAEEKIRLNRSEQQELLAVLINEMMGLGPLEPLLADDSVTDIMVNGPKQIYVEQGGKLQLSDTVFRDNQHVMNVAQRIVSQVGRRVDETTPLVDARLADGSRVNIIIPPLAIDGPTVSIRKFAKQKITIELMEKQANMSPAMATVLRIAGRSALNILISGGTGSGKTTLLNAISRNIDPGERIVTIEDAAELQLQQPHVVRLETRPANMEGQGEIAMRDLVKNALRMRPDRIILGEVRDGAAIDMLQAMNTGHEGSMSTIHANRPREALTRLENMVGMAGINLSPRAVRTQISDAIDMIIQVSRMRDGKRRITHIAEVVGMEGDVITMQELFTFNFKGEDTAGNLLGDFESTGVRANFMEKAAYFGLDKALKEALQ
ncbi:MAG: CpaF family protein [Alphaproteobacteria bacterium]|nr:CpaF family protein [Alphaproteobacteria bacterium]